MTANATLTISSRNYSSWSLRGWLICKLAGLDLEVKQLPMDDPQTKAELLLLSPSFLVPRLMHGKVVAWGPIAIGAYLHEEFPDAGLLPEDKVARAHARSINGEMHSGFSNLRAAMPMNLKAQHAGWKVWSGARDDVERIAEIWSECLEQYGGPYLLGERTISDAMFAPVCTRFRTYNVSLGEKLDAYVERILGMPEMKEWYAGAMQEVDAVEELEMEF
jgi:glutathione S-transferase